MGPDEEVADSRERRDPHGGLLVVAEDEEGGVERDHGAVACHGVGHGPHGVLPDPEVEVLPFGEVPHVFEVGLVRRSQVGAAADKPGDRFGDGVENLSVAVPGRDRFGLAEIGPVNGIEVGIEQPLQRFVLLGIGGLLEQMPPLFLKELSLLHGAAETQQHILGDVEALVGGEAGFFLGDLDHLFAQGCSVDFMVALQTHRLAADDGVGHDNGGTVAGLGFGKGRVDLVVAVAVDLEHLPVLGFETLFDIFVPGDGGFPFDGDVVAVVDQDQILEGETSRQGAGLVADPLLQVAVAAEAVDLVVDEPAGGGVDQTGGIGLGHGEADGVGDPLSQGTRGDLDPGGMAVLGMAGSPGTELPEVFEILHAQIVTPEIEEAVDESRGVAAGEDQAVPVEPVGVFGVVTQVLAEDHRDVRQPHGGARMAAVGLLDHVRRQETDRIRHLLTHFVRHIRPLHHLRFRFIAELGPPPRRTPDPVQAIGRNFPTLYSLTPLSQAYADGDSDGSSPPIPDGSVRRRFQNAFPDSRRGHRHRPEPPPGPGG